jgi:hypothetical protein
MIDTDRPQSQMKPEALRIILWTLAGEPLFLAGLAYFIKTQNAVKPVIGDGIGVLPIIFLAVSLAAEWFSFTLGSKYNQSGRSSTLSPRPEGISPTLMIAAVALATAPGILGFVLHLLTGTDWYLLAFNGGAFVLAAMQIINFSNRQA